MPTLHIDSIFTHAVALSQLFLDEDLTRLKLLTYIVEMDQPVTALNDGQLRRCNTARGK